MSRRTPFAVLINGPLGIGKSTLGEALGEALDRSVTLDGDSLVALNPPPADDRASLNASLALLAGHHLRHGYDRLVVNHYWSSQAEIAALEAALAAASPGIEVKCFRLTLPREENLRRIAARQSVRAIDETAMEADYFETEHRILNAAQGSELGEPFDVSGPLDELVTRMLGLLDLDD